MSADRTSRPADPERDAAALDDAIVIAVTPRNFRIRAVVFIVGGVLLTAVTVALWFRFHRELIGIAFGVVAVGYGIHCAMQAKRLVTHTLVRIDRSTLRFEGGGFDRSWSDVIMVWVGSQTGLRQPLVLQPVLSVFTRTGLEFARRAGTRPKPVYSVPIATGPFVSQWCDRLRALTTAEVVDGTKRSRRAAAASLERGPASTGSPEP